MCLTYAQPIPLSLSIKFLRNDRANIISRLIRLWLENVQWKHDFITDVIYLWEGQSYGYLIEQRTDYYYTIWPTCILCTCKLHAGVLIQETENSRYFQILINQSRLSNFPWPKVDRDFAFQLRDVAVNMHESSLTHQKYNISFLNFEKKKL